MAETRWLTERGGSTVGGRFFEAAVVALDDLQQMPGIGSPRLGEVCGLPSLRSWRIPGFGAYWFYVERAEHLDVIRLLGERQDLLTILGEER